MTEMVLTFSITMEIPPLALEIITVPQSQALLLLEEITPSVFQEVAPTAG